MRLFARTYKNFLDVFIGYFPRTFISDSGHQRSSSDIGMITAQHREPGMAHHDFRYFYGVF